MTDLVAVSSVMVSRYRGDNNLQHRFIQHADTRMSSTTVERLKENYIVKKSFGLQRQSVGFSGKVALVTGAAARKASYT
jgi:hypothetical protein